MKAFDISNLFDYLKYQRSQTLGSKDIAVYRKLEFVANNQILYHKIKTFNIKRMRRKELITYKTTQNLLYPPQVVIQLILMFSSYHMYLYCTCMGGPKNNFSVGVLSHFTFLQKIQIFFDNNS